MPSVPLPRPRAVLFDAYGTLFDVHSVGVLAERLFPGQGTALSQLWRDKQIEYTRLASMSGRDHSFAELTQAGLRYALQRLALAPDAAAIDALMQQYQRLAPFEENGEVLAALHERGVRCGVLSNGDPEMLSPLIAHAGFERWLRPVLSARTVRRFKTDAAVYALGPQALALPAAEILFVSSNGWDAIGATWFGYTTLWINRAGAPLDPLGTEPHRTGSSLRDVLDCFPD